MSTPAFSSQDFRTRLEFVLADAVERGRTSELAAARDYAALFTEPDLDLYRPDQIFQTFVVHFPPSSFNIHVEHVQDELVGDRERMSACVGALLKGMERGPDTVLMVEIFEQEEHSMMIPRMGIGFSGPGKMLEHFRFAELFPMTLAELSDCWTLATSGGRIDRTENGIELRLHGMRMPPEPLALAGQVRACLGGTPTAADAEEALALLEDTGPVDMLDLERMYTDSLAENEAYLRDSGVAFSHTFGKPFPQLPMNRVRMHGFLRSLFSWAAEGLPGGGTLEILAEYDAGTREATGIITLTAAKGPVADSGHLSLMKRAVVFHGGSFDVEFLDTEAALTFTLPDTVGQTLDGWLPGWEAFGAESRKYLRLLKSGAQAPPEDFILGGILEQELEGWLLPRLQEPATVNMVKDGTFRNEGLKGSIKERLQKALDQVGRGKPKKEICQPAYAGELLYAFRGSPRARAALGTQVLTDEELHALCESLLEKPVDALTALTRLAALLSRSRA